MKPISTKLLISLCLTLAAFSPAKALEQGPAVDRLSLDPIPFFEYKLHRSGGPEKFELRLPIALETEGIYGPLAPDSPVADYFWEKYRERGMKKALEYNPKDGKNYKTPFMRIFGVQALGTPVKIRIRAPEPDQITLPLPGPEGQTHYNRYRADRRRIHLNILGREGDMTLDKDKNKIRLVEDQDSFEISWVPSMVEDRRGPELTAPVVMEISLGYRITRETVAEGKVDPGWTQQGWVERRVAWLALPVCGQEFGEDDEPLACPASMAAGPGWQHHRLGLVSLQVPETWEARIRSDSGKFELGDGLAGIAVVREDGADKQLEYMKEVSEKKIQLSGLDAVEYTGRVKKGKVQARMVLFDQPLSDNRPICVATMLKDKKYAQILDAALNSVTIGGTPSIAPERSAAPAPHIPDLGDLGAGTYNFIPQDQVPDPGRTQEGGQSPADEPVQAALNPSSPEPDQDPVTARLTLKKLRGHGDFTGRGEALLSNGSPDTWLQLEIQAPDKTLKGMILRKADTKEAVWDTFPDNGAWLAAVTHKNKPVNQADGRLDYPLSQRMTLDLWIQDNHTIAAGKEEFELILKFKDSASLVIPMER